LEKVKTVSPWNISIRHGESKQDELWLSKQRWLYINCGQPPAATLTSGDSSALYLAEQ
jgi:hypothetical protein